MVSVTRLVFVVATVLGSLSSPSAADAGTTPPLTATVTVGVDGVPVVEHDCPAGSALGTYAFTLDLIVPIALGAVDEKPVVVDMAIGRVMLLTCLEGYDSATGGTDGLSFLGCFNAEGEINAGTIDRVVAVDCGGSSVGLYGEGFGEILFDYPDPRLPPYDVIVVSGNCPPDAPPVVRSAADGEVLATAPDDIALADALAAVGVIDGQVGLVGRCEPIVPLEFDYPPWCATVEVSGGEIAQLGPSGCAEHGAAFEFQVIDDDSVIVRSPCPSDAQIVQEFSHSDVLVLIPWGEVGEREVLRTDVPGRFKLTCAVQDGPLLGPVGCFARTESHGIVRYACGSYRPGEVTFAGLVLPYLPLEVSPDDGAADVFAACWADTIATMSLVDGTVVATAPGATMDRATRVAIPALARDWDGISSHELVARCVADGSTGLPSGRPICVRAWRSTDTLETYGWVPCEELGVADPPTSRVAIYGFAIGVDGAPEGTLTVEADCGAGRRARVAEIDAAGGVIAELGFSSTDRWVPIALPRPEGLVAEQIAAQCVDVTAGASGESAPINCYSSTPVQFAAEPGGGPFSHRACGFVSLRLPATGMATGLLVLSASALVLLGGMLLAASRGRLSRRRVVYSAATENGS